MSEPPPESQPESSLDPDPDPQPQPGTAVRPETDWERRRRIAAVFGDVLPDTTNDERDAGEQASGRESGRETASDVWLKSQVPPHHGG